MANFDVFFPRLMEHEGGYTNHPNDSGGPTNWGITQQVLSEYKGYQASISDVKNLTQAEAKIIYKKRYWNPLKLDDVNSQHVAETIYDMGVNAGIARAAKMVQEILNTSFNKNLAVDGAIGNQTIQAINSVSANSLYNQFNYMRQKYYTFIANRFDTQAADSTYYAEFFKADLKVAKQEKNSVFLNGWLNRLSSFPYLKETGIGLGLVAIAVVAFFL